MNGKYHITEDLPSGDSYTRYVVRDPQGKALFWSYEKSVPTIVVTELNHLLKMVQESYETQPQAAS